jgi:Uma2 family endonuclease
VPGRFLQVVPDLIVEILLPSTSKYDREVKKTIYARAGVREYWIVDGRAREVHVFRLGEAGAARYGKEQVFTAGDEAPSEAVPGWAVGVGSCFFPSAALRGRSARPPTVGKRCASGTRECLL